MARPHWIAMLVVFTSLLVLPSTSLAGVWEYRPCAISAGDAPSMRPAYVSFTGASGSECGGGTTLDVTPDGDQIGPSGVDVAFTLPPGLPATAIDHVDVPITMGAKTGDAGSSGSVTEQLFAGASGGALLQTASWGGGTIGPVSSNDAGLAVPPEATSLVVTINCATTCHYAPQPGMQSDIEMFPSIFLQDNAPPAPAVIQDPSAGGAVTQLQRGATGSFTMTLSDADSGVAKVDLLTDSGQVVGSRDFSGDCRDWKVPACPATETTAVSFSPGSLTDGVQSLVVRTTDWSGGTSVARTPQFDVVENPVFVPTPTPTPTPAPAPLNGGAAGPFTLRLAGSLTSGKVLAAFGKQVAISGTLTAASKPVAGAAVDILSTLALAGAPKTKLATVTTNAQGQFTYEAVAAASAALVVAVPAHAGAGDYVATKPVDLRVEPKLTLSGRKAARRGVKVKLTGTVALNPLPAAGARVVIEFELATGWQDVAVVRAKSSGAFSWTHVYSHTGTYHFRAQVLRTSDLAGVSSTSPVITLRIH